MALSTSSVCDVGAPLPACGFTELLPSITHYQWLAQTMQHPRHLRDLGPGLRAGRRLVSHHLRRVVRHQRRGRRRHLGPAASCARKEVSHRHQARPVLAAAAPRPPIAAPGRPHLNLPKVARQFAKAFGARAWRRRAGRPAWRARPGRNARAHARFGVSEKP